MITCGGRTRIQRISLGACKEQSVRAQTRSCRAQRPWQYDRTPRECMWALPTYSLAREDLLHVDGLELCGVVLVHSSIAADCVWRLCSGTMSRTDPLPSFKRVVYRHALTKELPLSLAQSLSHSSPRPLWEARRGRGLAKSISWPSLPRARAVCSARLKDSRRADAESVRGRSLSAVGVCSGLLLASLATHLPRRSLAAGAPPHCCQTWWAGAWSVDGSRASAAGAAPPCMRLGCYGTWPLQGG